MQKKDKGRDSLGVEGSQRRRTYYNENSKNKRSKEARIKKKQRGLSEWELRSTGRIQSARGKELKKVISEDVAAAGRREKKEKKRKHREDD